MRSMNPVLQDSIFDRASSFAEEDRMTISGTTNKALALTAICFTAAIMSWEYFKINPQSIGLVTIGGGVIGLVLFFIMMFKPTWSPVLSSLYAIVQGAAVGGLSLMMDQQFPGIVPQAVMLTFGDLAVMLFLYRTGIIKVTNKLRMGVMAAGGAIFLIYMADIIMGFFGSGMPIIHEASPLGIGFSLLVVGLASFFLLLDFDNIERGARMGAPKYMEWMSAFGLLVTLIWLYIEILKLLSKMRSR